MARPTRPPSGRPPAGVRPARLLGRPLRRPRDGRPDALIAHAGAHGGHDRAGRRMASQRLVIRFADGAVGTRISSVSTSGNSRPDRPARPRARSARHRRGPCARRPRRQQSLRPAKTGTSRPTGLGHRRRRGVGRNPPSRRRRLHPRRSGIPRRHLDNPMTLVDTEPALASPSCPPGGVTSRGPCRARWIHTGPDQHQWIHRHGVERLSHISFKIDVEAARHPSPAVTSVERVAPAAVPLRVRQPGRGREAQRTGVTRRCCGWFAAVAQSYRELRDLEQGIERTGASPGGCPSRVALSAWPRRPRSVADELP